MNMDASFSRRLFLKRSGATGLGWAAFVGLEAAPGCLRAAESAPKEADWLRRIVDPEIRAGMEAAVFKNLIPAATERAYPGDFTINADGGGYGSD
jgi:hypothetical protein